MRRSTRVAVATPLMEAVERRLFLAAGGDATLKMPVFNYHRVLPPVDDPNDKNGPEEYAKQHNIFEDRFKAQLALLAKHKFQSVTPTNYRAWVNGAPLKVGYDEHVLRDGERPFMAIFDDSNKTELRAADLLKGYNFTGVAAVTTQDDPATPDYDGRADTPNYHVGNVAKGYMTWGEVRTLVSAKYKWELASHSWDHLALGDGVARDFPNKGGTAKAKSYFRNTPAEIETQLRTSRQDIIDNVFAGDADKAPIAFVHPYHDLTRRTLSVASTLYPLVFGRAFPTNDPAVPPEFAGKTSNLQNGELARIEVVRTTSDGDFEAALLAAMTGAFVRPVHVQKEIPIGYVASDGTVVVDGLDGADAISVDDDRVTLPAWSDAAGAVVPQTINVKDFRVNQYNYAVGYEALNIDGGKGNDAIVVVKSLGSATRSATILGGDGNDRLVGGERDETLGGGAGKDTIDGGLGNDRLNGNGGHDRLFGGAGADRLYGYDGNDWLDGGSSGDRLEGGAGTDALFGQGGEDRFFCADGEADQLFGGKERDTAAVDPEDVLASIEIRQEV
jgi:hypothetical protein